MPRRSRRLSIAICALSLAGIAVTFNRWPTFWPDAQLYASIARARELTGSGVPSMIRHSPYATDHVVFYGPVFFDLGAAAFTVFGVSKWAFRLVSMAGALLFVGAGALLARTLGGTSGRAWWSAALLLLTPELFLHARSGSMDLVGVGFEVLALAFYIRGLLQSERSWPDGAAAGVALALAALTTPRTYPFVAAFLLTGAGQAVAARRPSVWRTLTAALLVFGSVFGMWIASVPGGAVVWARYVVFVATHEASDVALLLTDRLWAVALSGLITPAAAAAGACAAAWTLRHRREDEKKQRAIAFGLVACWITFVSTACVMNFTMTVSTYFALPLFAVIVSLPAWCFPAGPPSIRARGLAAAVAVLLVCDGTVAAVRYIRIGAGWDARDPEPVVNFLRSHVPPGSDVVAPMGRYFFSVERAGASYFTYDPKSWADWAQWVPEIEPAAVGPEPRRRPVIARFLIWDADEPMPAGYDCANAHLLATYTPPPANAAASLGWIAESDDRGYERFGLYQLGAACPEGYDPTGSRMPSYRTLR